MLRNEMKCAKLGSDHPFRSTRHHDVEDATDTAVFLAFLDQVLTGARFLYLPPYSPDLNPIEKCWAKIKLVLRTLKARTAETLDPAITAAITAITSQDEDEAS